MNLDLFSQKTTNAHCRLETVHFTVHSDRSSLASKHIHTHTRHLLRVHIMAHEQPVSVEECAALYIRLYPLKYNNCFSLMAPRRLDRRKETASIGSIPVNSIKAIATITGARPSPATQCTAMAGPLSPPGGDDELV
mmetsp:Transcript_21435/g.46456  ORF Transcript_21435/g.46456 Transcript_21435/m.46456 type:complete len:136 (-) Transcript_21435:394-801(-)